MRYLDSDLKYSEPQVGPTLYHVTIDTSHDTLHHIAVRLEGDRQDYKEGEMVKVLADPYGDGGWQSRYTDAVGWLPTGTEFYLSKLRDMVTFWQQLGTTQFTMPAYDVTVYSYCEGKDHGGV